MLELKRHGLSCMAGVAIVLLIVCALRAQTPASQPAPIRVSIVIHDLLVDGAQIRNEGTLLQAVRFGSADDLTAFGIKWSKWPGKPACNCTTEWPKAKEETAIVDAQGKTFTGDAAELPVATEVAMQNSIRYYTEEGDQLGRGPLPPQVGETTKYWVFVQITNTTNTAIISTINIPTCFHRSSIWNSEPKIICR